MKNITLILFCLTSVIAKSQNNDSTHSGIPAQISFIYPLSTNGINSKNISNYLSFNLFYGLNGGLNGLELGALVNSNLSDVNGIQMAGLANINTKSANGIILSGLVNIANDSSKAISLAGLSNLNNGNYLGIQAAGLTNTVKGDYIGIQTAGISNFNTGDYFGGQFAGITNTTLGNLTGMQAGLINKAKKVNGLQVGLINIADEFETGIPIGLFSFIKNGFHALDIEHNESVYGNLNLKLGVKHFYNIFKFGYMPKKGHEHITYGYGVGSMVSITDNFKLSLDVTGNHIVANPNVFKIDFLAKTDLNLRYHLTKNIGFFAGPSFNIYFSENNEDNTTTLHVPHTIYKENWWNGDGKSYYWLSYNAGISVMF